MSIPFWLLLLAGVTGQQTATDNLQSLVQSIEVPAGEQVVLTAEGSGVQIYRCEKKTDATEWKFVEPEAKLYAKGAEIGTHAAGPVWHLRDGSSAWGEVLAKSASTKPGSIPALLLKATKTEGSGLLTGVNYIQRLKTDGGNAPDGPCDVGTVTRVPYSATYAFYRAKE